MLTPFLTIRMPLDPVVFSFGPFAVHWYGIGYGLAIAAGLWFILRYAPTRGVSTETVWSVATWAVPAGLIGGRLYYVVQNHPGTYLSHPTQILQVWHGGMAFFGAIVAVLLVVAAISLVRRLPLLPMLDVAALFALMGQPIGRLGNVINGDIVGPATNLPWGFLYTNVHTFAPSTTTAYQPAAIYEIIANLMLIAVLFPLRKRLAPGLFAAAYVAGYCVTQLVVFEWRTEPIVLFGLRQAQVTAIVMLVLEAALVAAVLLLRRRGGGRPAMRVGDRPSSPAREQAPREESKVAGASPRL